MKKTSNPRIAAFFAALIVLIFFFGLEYLERLRYQESLQTLTINRLSQIRAGLESEINANFYLTRGLIAYVSTHPEIDEHTFQRISHQLLKHHNYIRNIALAPNNIVRFVYPLQGNEKAIGLKYQNNTEQWPAVARAIAARKTVVAGPVNLIQGGVGFISRTPIYTASDSDMPRDELYWGLASIVIEKYPLFKAAGFYDNLDILIAIRGKDGLGEKGGIFEGDPKIFNRNPVLQPVHLPEGEWQLAATPINGWDSPSPYLLPIRILALLLTSLIGWITFTWLQQQENTRTILEAAWQDAQKAQATLKLNEDFLNTVFDNIPAMIFVKEAESLRFVRFNRTGAELLGYSASDFLGKTDFDFFTEAEANFFTKKDREVFASRQLLDIPEESIITQNNKQIILHTKKIPIYDHLGNPLYLIGISEDITEQVAARAEKELLEKQLHQAQKLETIGKMAGGVAHDLNNILSGIINYPELLLLKLPQDSPLRKPLEEIQDSGKRAANVVADLLTIARGVAAVRKIIDINILVTDYLNSPEYRKLLAQHNKITCTTDLDPQAGNISCSPVHIKKCLMNIVHNAAESFTNGNEGKIIIATAHQKLCEPLPGFPDIGCGNFARLSITDNGPGIPSSDLEHIFEPFYTKKNMGISGTGLGLTVVWNTVNDHRGGLTVTSHGGGTVFSLFFPIANNEITTAPAMIEIEDLCGHGQTILVVDDDPNQRDIASKILKVLQYSVEVVSSGEAAIHFLKTTSVDLILLDMIMEPGMNGRQTYEAIITFNPGQKAIIASGYAENEEVVMLQKLGAGQYVKKPYTLEQLGLAVQLALK